MKLYVVNERPSVLPAACAPGYALPAPIVPVVSAHASRVSWVDVPGAKVVQARVQIWMDRQMAQVQGTNGFVAKQDVTALKPIGGVRGVPPRGRPV